MQKKLKKKIVLQEHNQCSKTSENTCWVPTHFVIRVHFHGRYKYRQSLKASHVTRLGAHADDIKFLKVTIIPCGSTFLGGGGGVCGAKNVQAQASFSCIVILHIR